MELIRPFERISKGDAAIAGGKGASLGEMTQAGIPVPPGFVVLSHAFERFLDEANLNQELDAIFHSVDHQQIRTVDQASERIRALITSARMPEDIAEAIRVEFAKLDSRFVAVRSSATAEDGSTAAWAGQLETYLNTTDADLIENVQKCWASLFTPRAIFYRFEKGMHGSKISVAVVVQKMVQSEVSGIAFSVHPVTEDYNQLIIEAGFGLGEAIVSGQVTPDSFVVEKEPRRMIDKNITFQSRALWRAEQEGNEWRELSQEEGSKPALSDEQVLELAEMVLHIETHYGFPCDIEWAFEAGHFYITQSRPITTLQKRDPRESLLVASDYHYAGLWRSLPFAIWFWSAWKVEELCNLTGLHADFGGELSVTGGHFYMHKKTRQQFGATFIEHFEAKNVAFYECFAAEAQKVYQDSAVFAARLPHATESREELFNQIVSHAQRMMFFWCAGWLASDVLDEHIQKAATRAGISEAEIQKYIPQPDTPMLAQQADLRILKQKLQEDGVWDILKSDASQAIKKIRETPALFSLLEEHRTKYEWLQMMNWVGERLTLEMLLEQMTFLPTVSTEEAHTKESFAPYAEMTRQIAYVRQGGAEFSGILINASLELLRKVADDRGLTYEEMLHLVPPEIYGDQPETLKEKVARRQQDNWIIYTDTDEVVHVIDDKELVSRLAEKLLPRPESASHDEIRGQVGNKGIARGPVRIIYATDDFHKMQEGDVLVTTMTTPDFVLLMQKSAAIVTDMGGLLCHAAIVSREMGKPCVIDTKFATQILKDGDMVEVDANHGIVRKLGDSGHPMVILGAWNVYPLDGWSWFADGAIEHFRKLTGIAVRTVTVLKDDLSYDCVFQSMLDEMQVAIERHEDFPSEIEYAKHIYDDFDACVPKLEAAIEKGETLDFATLSNEQLASYLDEQTDAFLRVTMQIWYAVFLDLMYPATDEKKEIKAIAAKARDRTGHLHGRKFEIDKRLLPEIAKRLSVTETQLNYLIPPEVADALRGGTDYRAVADARQKLCVYDSTDGTTLHMRDGVEAQEVVDRYKPPMLGSKPQTMLKGTPASKGVISAKVRVIRFDKEFDSFQEGEVLVTPQTMVHYLPVMQKSSAILTEFGGLTSHAAIVSRELSKPAIVGIPNLLASLSDGDLVEVDADTGTVRVLEKTVADSLTYQWTSGGVTVLLSSTLCDERSFGAIDYVYLIEKDLNRAYLRRNGVQECYQLGFRLLDPAFVLEMNEKVSVISEKLKSYRCPELTSGNILAEWDRLSALYVDLWEVYVYSNIYQERPLEEVLLKECTQDEVIDLIQGKSSKQLTQTGEHALRTLVLLGENKLSLHEKLTVLIDAYDVFAAYFEEHFGLERSLFFALTQGEVRSVLLGEKIPREEAERRREGCAMLKEDGIWKFLTGEEFLSWRSRIEAVEPKEIKGTGAYKGVATGAVARHVDWNGVRDVPEGAILVTGMTNPQMVPYLKHAAGIITDEGGLTCHAAIIARELKIPCIVGTQVASKLLKDGDMIEMDAHTGLVRKVDHSQI